MWCEHILLLWNNLFILLLICFRVIYVCIYLYIYIYIFGGYFYIFCPLYLVGRCNISVALLPLFGKIKHRPTIIFRPSNRDSLYF